jgi:hypothetical protein
MSDFQWIIDSADSISIERKQVVASTTSRSGVTRTVSRGGQTWVFEAKVADGIPWTTLRGYISKAEKLDRVTQSTIQINSTGHSWLTGYQGNSVNSTGFQATWTQGATSITLTTSPTTASGYKFKAGDFIQLTTGHVYTVSADVAYNSNTVTLHRPILDATVATGTAISVGQNCTWSVVCVQFPKWTIMARDQVSWDGAFIFHEYML